MARIAGDTADLPAAWSVDGDNWGKRPTRSTDQARVAIIHSNKAPKGLYSTACMERGSTFVMSAATARFLDTGAV
jgi:hypothetical protein